MFIHPYIPYILSRQFVLMRFLVMIWMNNGEKGKITMSEPSKHHQWGATFRQDRVDDHFKNNKMIFPTKNALRLTKVWN